MCVIVWAWAEQISSWTQSFRSENGYSKGCTGKRRACCKKPLKRLPASRQWPLQSKLTKDMWCGWANSSWIQDKLYYEMKTSGCLPNKWKPGKARIWKGRQSTKFTTLYCFSSAQEKTVSLCSPSVFPWDWRAPRCSYLLAFVGSFTEQEILDYFAFSRKMLRQIHQHWAVYFKMVQDGRGTPRPQ